MEITGSFWPLAPQVQQFILAVRFAFKRSTAIQRIVIHSVYYTLCMKTGAHHSNEHHQEPLLNVGRF